MKWPILGFFKDFVVGYGEGVRCLGTLQVPYEPGRKCGAEGMMEETFTEPLTLDRAAGKKVTYPASPTKPIVARTSLQMTVGHMERSDVEIDGPYFDTVTKTVHGIPGFNPGFGWTAVDS